MARGERGNRHDGWMRSMPRVFNYFDGHKSHRDSWQVSLTFAG
jgi:hypothetical protein